MVITRNRIDHFNRLDNTLFVKLKIFSESILFKNRSKVFIIFTYENLEKLNERKMVGFLTVCNTALYSCRNPVITCIKPIFVLSSHLYRIQSDTTVSNFVPFFFASQLFLLSATTFPESQQGQF